MQDRASLTSVSGPVDRRAQLLALRAERLARLAGRSGPSEAPGVARPPDVAPAGGDDTEAALEAFLSALSGAIEPAPKPEVRAEILPFARNPERTPEKPAVTDLARLPGIGPGLIAALERAGIADLGVLAASSGEDLAERLGPVGQLINLRAWIAFAQREAGQG